MDNKKFDDLIKDYFDDITEKVDCRPEMLKQIEMGANNNHGKAETSKYNNRYKNFIGLNMKRVALLALCFIIMSMGLTVVVSAEARNFVKDAYNSIVSIFIVKEDKDGVSISKVSDTTLIDKTFGGQLDESNLTKEEVKKKLGIDPFFPNEFGGRCSKILSFWLTTVYQISYREGKELSNKLLTEDRDAVFSALKNEKKNSLGGLYLDNKSYKNFSIYMESAVQKHVGTGKLIEEFDIEGVQCVYISTNHAEYQTNDSSFVTSDDRTIKDTEYDWSKEPYYIGKYYYIKWKYNDVNYAVGVENESDYEDAKDFAAVYIKELKKATK